MKIGLLSDQIYKYKSLDTHGLYLIKEIRWGFTFLVQLTNLFIVFIC